MSAKSAPSYAKFWRCIEHRQCPSTVDPKETTR
jgi:hypothetical protein